MLEAERVERVIVAPSHEGGDDVVDIVRMATASGVRVTVLPRLLEVIGTSVEFDDLGGRVLLGVRGFGLSPSSRLLKRVVRPPGDDCPAGVPLAAAARYRRWRSSSARRAPCCFAKPASDATATSSRC